MKKRDKTKKQPINELTQLSRRIAELKASGRKRNQFEETLRIERDKAQQYLDIAEVILVALNKKGEITLINRKGNQILGYKEGELLGNNWFTTCLPSHLRKKMKSGFLKLMAGEREITEFYETPGLTKSGTEKMIAWHNTVLKDAAGNIIGTLSSGEDITERKQAKDKVRESKQLLEKTFLSLRDALLIIDANTLKILDCNPATSEIFGYDRNEIVGQSVNVLHVEEKTLEEFRSHLYAAIETHGFLSRFEFKMKRKGGMIFPTEHSVIPIEDEQGNRIRWVSMVRDITDRKKAEEALRDGEATLRALINAPTDSVLLLDTRGVILDINEIAAERLGKSRDELIGTLADDALPEATAKRRRSIISQIFETGREVRFEDERDGIWYDTVAHPITDKDGAVSRLAIIARDITDRKKAEEALRKSEDKYRTILENIEEGYYEVDLAGNFTFFNDAMCRIWGYPKEELIGMNNRQYTNKENAKKLFQAFNEVYRTEKIGKGYDYEIIKKDGTRSYVEASISLRKDSSGKATGFRGIVRDITERKEAEKKQQESEERFRLAFENANTGVCLVDLEGNLARVNSKMCEIFGYTKEELERMTVNDIAHPADIDKSPEFIQKTLLGEIDRATFEKRYIHKKGHVVTCEVSSTLVRNAEGAPLYFISHVHDITDRKRLEENLGKEREDLKLIIDSSPIIVFYKDKEGRFIRVNKTFAEALKMPEGDFVGKTVFDLYSPQIAQGMTDDDKEVFQSRRPKLSIIEQYESASGIRWVQTDKIPIFDKDGVPIGLIGFAQDITDRKRAEEEVKRGYEQLQETLHATVRALASTVEMKDQYTAGHQPRVTKLACAIAEEMGLPAEQIEGIRMSASIHDIGKIMVPAEILNKPGPLTEIQYEMIKMHPRAGYDILKGLKLPWPVAQIILQHHERMDGSGYPQGLSGDEIMLEARILTVANVVEAMNAHRPYRPAHHIKVALAEIAQNRGIFYDSAVVDACLRLFTKKGFILDSVPG